MRALSGELDYRIRYDVEHDLFHAQNIFNNEYIKPTFIEYVQKLEEKISVLLSCKNCPENKDCLICAKEYENKCLAQKIEFIKELEQQIEKMKCWCNCKNYISCLKECCKKNISFEKGICYNCKKWELRR